MSEKGITYQTLIGALQPETKNITVTFIVLDVGEPIHTKGGHKVRTCKVADPTGSVNITAWDSVGDALQPGDICRLSGGYTQYWKGCLTLYTGKGGDTVKIGEFCYPFVEIPNMSEPNPEILAKMAEQCQGHSGKRPAPESEDGVNNHPVSKSRATLNGNRPLRYPMMHQRGGRMMNSGGRPRPGSS